MIEVWIKDADGKIYPWGTCTIAEDLIQLGNIEVMKPPELDYRKWTDAGIDMSVPFARYSFKIETVQQCKCEMMSGTPLEFTRSKRVIMINASDMFDCELLPGWDEDVIDRPGEIVSSRPSSGYCLK